MNITYGILPMAMFLFGYAVVCAMTSALYVKFEIGGKIMALFGRYVVCYVVVTDESKV